MHIRPLRADDLDRELEFVQGLSPHTLYLRVQYSTAHVTRDDLRRLLDLDYRDRFAFAALVPDGGTEHIVGVSRYARVADTTHGECAVVVADAWQGCGLGTELMRSLAYAARERGLQTLEGEVLGENQRSYEWARRFGFTARTEPHSGGMVHVALDLTALAWPPASDANPHGAAPD